MNEDAIDTLSSYPDGVVLCGGDHRTQLQCKDFKLVKTGQCKMGETCRSDTTPTKVVGSLPEDVDGTVTPDWSPYQSGPENETTCDDEITPPKGFDDPWDWSCKKGSS